ncbi:hypothetical protein EVAR_71755_1 [Eumeta japonica]|uniref:Cyclin C-terminal domain-containing protein n=1 Tax=Eumeta variegata TaxID=151549 RepID=A0A4C1SWL2_EUMVA|nr:hypothetical protein EVAR_71755_1 [Eumeta japonica]
MIETLFDAMMDISVINVGHLTGQMTVIVPVGSLTLELEEITTYRLEDLSEVFLSLCKSHNAAVALAQQAVQEKYKAEKYRQVSTITPQKSLKSNLKKLSKIIKKSNEKINKLIQLQQLWGPTQQQRLVQRK